MNYVKYLLIKFRMWRQVVVIYDELHYFNAQINTIGLLLSKKIYKTRLFCFFNSYSTGGAEKVQLQIALAVSDVKPTIFFLNYAENEQYKNSFEKISTVVNLYENLKRRDIFTQIILRILAYKISAINPVTVFGGDSKFYLSLIPLLENHVKVIDLFHSLVHEYEEGTETWSLPVTQRINNRICISEKLKNDFVNWYEKNNLPKEMANHLIVIYNYVDLPTISKKETKSGNLIVLFVCRNDKVKRLNIAAKIAQRLYKEGFEFYFIGQKLIDDVPIDVRESINFTGNISNEVEKMSYYEKANILMMTSSREGTPMVILEAMANGVVTISTDVGGISEMITNKEGVLVEMTIDEDKQVEIFCKELLNLKHNRDKLILMGELARQKVELTFSKNKFEFAYRNILVDK